MEHTTGPDENHAIEIPQQASEDDQNTQKKPKKTPVKHQKIILKNPENCQNTPLQEEPLDVRGEKLNLRLNPNLSYSD